MRHLKFARKTLPSLFALFVLFSSSARAEVNLEKGISLSRVRLALQGRKSLTEFELEWISTEKDRDERGAFERLRYKLIGIDSLDAELRLKRYPGLMTASLDYRGPRLAEKDSVQLVMKLPEYRRGMAINHIDPYWAGPSFSSDYRLLPENNVLMLWQRQKGPGYHLLVPLAGDGMVGEVGKHNLQFGVTMSSFAPNTPRHIPLFAYATDEDPYRLADRVYTEAFREGKFYGRLRKEKKYPEPFRYLGWCSWNAYYDKVSEEHLVASAESLRKKKIPVGFMLIDDGWLNTTWRKLAGFEADLQKFPRGLRGAIAKIKDLGIKHVGVWHTLHGYWDGLDPRSFKDEKLFEGLDGLFMQDPRQESDGFYHAWYQKLAASGIDFVKVDGQANTSRFTNGLLPLFSASEGTQRNLQEAASRYLSSKSDPPVINCMEMTIENAYNWRFSNVARASDDFQPHDPALAKEHVFQSAYNSYWISNFAYPDYDMFQSNLPQAKYHAIARAVSGGPIYTADEIGEENVELLKRLAFSDGRLLMLDEPGRVTRDTLLVDTGIERVPLKIFGQVLRPGFKAGVVAAFNVNKSCSQVLGGLSGKDVDGLRSEKNEGNERIAVYQRSTGRVHLLEGDSPLPLRLGEYGADLFSLVPVKGSVAVFGLLDKYLSPAAILRQELRPDGIAVTLAEGGEFGAFLKKRPLEVRIDGKKLPVSSYTYRDGLLRIPPGRFPEKGACEVRIVLQRAPSSK